MEFYMGRTLTNTMLNLGIQNACDEALYQVVMCTCVVWYLLFYSDFFLNLKLIKAAQTALINNNNNNNNRISIAPYGRNFRGAGLDCAHLSLCYVAL